MKKKYITPEAKTIMIETEGIIAESLYISDEEVKGQNALSAEPRTTLWGN